MPLGKGKEHAAVHPELGVALHMTGEVRCAALHRSGWGKSVLLVPLLDAALQPDVFGG